ncbi:chemotaxis protein CheD [Thalassobacillus pellis]|uniref:chemotaxis protein CheD n=1 Tax=Thalassobacillus pellis TaxID=748008 RepID=UPI001961FF77|nr:chemotaxis protein CheD [Thalassobacillus pellis]MBM7552726.1 chemotaxis protein CheD [Thalassobacillus pellis]
MNDAPHIIKVGIAGMETVQAPDIIRTSGLGSCVGVVVFDKSRKMGGMCHVMLPDSSMAKSGSPNKGKYADSAIDELIKMLLQAGLKKYTLKAKLAGGAQMFQFTSADDKMRIGPRNIKAVKDRLSLHGIPVLGEDVGGNSGRTIEFDPDTAMLTIRSVNKGVADI